MREFGEPPVLPEPVPHRSLSRTCGAIAGVAVVLAVTVGVVLVAVGVLWRLAGWAIP